MNGSVETRRDETETKNLKRNEEIKEMLGPACQAGILTLQAR